MKNNHLQYHKGLYGGVKYKSLKQRTNFTIRATIDDMERRC